MAGHVFHEIFLHLNWHTKNSLPFLNQSLESPVREYLQNRCRNTKGVYFHAVHGTPTHVHLAINIEPFVTISDLVRDLKGGCSHDINQARRDKVLQWQRGFGVVSFGKQQLPWVKEYIANQKKHHASGRVFDRLERTTTDDDGTPWPDA